MTRIKNIINYILNDIARFFPYIFIFYLVSFILSLFLESWQEFFNWKVFHFGILFLVILSLLSPISRPFFKNFQQLNSKNRFLEIFNKISKFLEKYQKLDYLKILILLIFVILGIFYWQWDLISLIVLIFCFWSILFNFKVKIHFYLLIIFIVLTAFTYKFFPDYSDILAIYAFYFLISFLFLQIRKNLA